MATAQVFVVVANKVEGNFLGCLIVNNTETGCFLDQISVIGNDPIAAARPKLGYIIATCVGSAG